MDFNLKQWRDDESDKQQQQQEPPSKQPRLHHHFQPNTNLSAFFSDHSTSDSATKFIKMGSYFSLSQWQELELQALIFRHMISGHDVPPELLHLVKKSVVNSPYYLSHHQYYHPSLLQSGYWGRAAMDPEPGRCRRTDGKKWRCARDVVAGQKYCERHMHRGKNRSRKPVETPTSTAATAAPYGGGANHLVTREVVADGGDAPRFTLSEHSNSTDLLHLNQSGVCRPPGSIIDSNDGPGRLRHFFDDWPKPIQETDDGASSMASATNLSISMPGNASSDFSLKLGTGNGDEPSTKVASSEREKPMPNWVMAWGTNPVSPMGGPLAEALRSSMSTSSPTSVLHRMPRGGPASEASY